ncbi:MAG TPA: CBS and ACT domain-containing protein [Candidatus Methylomirabilis sp.]|nr:CBS and ACT domain-containing protein [Candidatus Methylomirabilis sp.]
MKKTIVTVTPSTSLLEAQGRMRGHNIRQVPVVSEDGTLLGIVSDRDIRAAVLPAGLVPGFTAEAAGKFMENTPVERVMTRKVITATLTDTLEDAIVLLHDFRVNALPVVDAGGKIAGIITRTDVLEAFIEALGVGEVSSRLEVVVPDRPGTLAQLAAIIGSFHVNITSVLTTRHVEDGTRANFFRVATLNIGPIRKAIEEGGFEILDPSRYTLR